MRNMDAPNAFKNVAEELHAMQQSNTAGAAEKNDSSLDLERSPSEAGIENGRNLKDQLHEYDADDDDDGDDDDDDADVIIVKVKNGCENTRLSEHVAGRGGGGGGGGVGGSSSNSLHSRLEHVQIDAKVKPKLSLAKMARAELVSGEQKIECEQKQQNQTTQGHNQNKLDAQSQPKEHDGNTGPACERNKGNIYGKNATIVGSPNASTNAVVQAGECMGHAYDQFPTTASLAFSITSSPVSVNSKLTICTNAISSSSSSSSTAHYNPPNQLLCHNHANTSLKQQRQLSFLKSQSLELYNDNSTISTINEHNDYQHLLFNQLPEIREIRFSDAQSSSQLQPQSELAQTEAAAESHAQSQIPASAAGDNANSSLKNVDKGLALGHCHSVDVASADGGVRSIQRPSMTSRFQSLDSRPIYPNVPFSPYASPYGSPRTHRRPLRESRRISIEKSGSFLQLNQYKLMDQIGQGSYGLVKLAYSEEDSTHYAMKILSKRRLLRQAGLMRRGPKKTTSPLDRVYREIAVLKKLDHPNVVKLVEVLDDPVEDSLYMVFELVKQGEVLSIPTDKPLTEERAWSVFRDTLLGLEYLHYQRIIHADIKPGNLLLTECGRVKIADLGVCNEFLGEDATMTNGSTAGTPAFRAPETCVLGQNVYCGRAADLWALGATLYSLVFGKVPFLANSIPLLYEKIQNEPLTFPAVPVISEELKNCIELMLNKEAGKRITLPQLKQNDWVTGCGRHPLPSEDENCRLVQVNDDDINSVVRSIPKLDTLILIKTMLKKHSFGNPFAKGISGRAPQRGGSRLERFVRAGRSNSAPGSYHMPIDRQLSGDIMLPALSELVPSTQNDEC